MAVLLTWTVYAWQRHAPIDEPQPRHTPRPDPNEPVPANVILIVLDTVRADHLPIYGYHRNTTPNLAAFAEEAVVCKRAIATSPWTLPSHASLFTGLLPSEHGAHSVITPHSDLRRPETYVRPLSEAYTTLAERLSAHGYATAAVVGNSGFVRRDWGVSQGFNYYDDRDHISLRTVRPRTLSPALWMCRLYPRLRGYESVMRNAEQVNEAVFAWLDRGVRSPFFLFVNYIDAHYPYRAHPELAIKAMPGQVPETLSEEARNYDAEIAFVDAHLGHLFDRLRTSGLYDNSLIIVVSDHGEALGEHGNTEHCNSLYEEEVWVPLVVRYPAGRERVIAELPASIASVFTTVLLTAGIARGPQPAPEAESPRSEVVAELYPPKDRNGRKHPGWAMRAVYTLDNRKAIQGTTPTGRTEVYDLAMDPLEQQDAAAAHEDYARWAQGWLNAWAGAAQSRRLDDAAVATLSDDLVDKLTVLGYVDPFPAISTHPNTPLHE